MNHFPWFKPGYQNIYDDLVRDPMKEKGSKRKITVAHNYPKAAETDQKIILYEGLE